MSILAFDQLLTKCIRRRCNWLRKLRFVETSKQGMSPCFFLCSVLIFAQRYLAHLALDNARDVVLKFMDSKSKRSISSKVPTVLFDLQQGELPLRRGCRYMPM